MSLMKSRPGNPVRQGYLHAGDAYLPRAGDEFSPCGLWPQEFLTSSIVRTITTQGPYSNTA